MVDTLASINYIQVERNTCLNALRLFFLIRNEFIDYVVDGCRRVKNRFIAKLNLIDMPTLNGELLFRQIT